MNEYCPWEQEGISELEYFKKSYLASRTELNEALSLIEKMKNCANCTHNTNLETTPEVCVDCGRKSNYTDYPNWELEV